MNRLEGKVAFITGAANGMGLEAVKLFLNEGAKVFATDIDEELLIKGTSELGENVKAMKLDVTSPEEWVKTVEEAEKAFGKIDILINNAGVSTHCGLVEETYEGWMKNINVNLTSVWLGMKTVIPYMQKIGGGSIVNCSSLSAIIGSADNGAAAYCAAKGGVRSLSRHGAYAYAKDNIRVNSVYPGATLSGAVTKYGVTSREVLGMGFKDRIPLPPHAGDSIDIAYAYLYLASDESRFVTGEELIVDGGWSIQ